MFYKTIWKAKKRKIKIKIDFKKIKIEFKKKVRKHKEKTKKRYKNLKNWNKERKLFGVLKYLDVTKYLIPENLLWKVQT